MKYRIRKKFDFEAAHILDKAYSTDCATTIHGHSYIVEVFLTSKCLNSHLMVVDFGVLKPVIDEIKEHYDHALFLSQKRLKEHPEIRSFNQKLVVMDVQPTAEVMAESMLRMFIKSIDEMFEDNVTELKVEKVRVHETEDGFAEAINE